MQMHMQMSAGHANGMQMRAGHAKRVRTRAVHAASRGCRRLGCALGPASCSPTPRSPEDCRRLRTCSECLAQHPRALRHGAPALPQCKWCTNCPEGACIGSAGSCTSENDCRINQREIFVASNCSEVSCEASDCSKCTASGKCMWTRQFKRTGETRRILSVQPTYDWTCFSHSLLNVSPMPVESSPPLACPTPCHNHSSCQHCLGSKGADGGWQHCVWSVSLQQVRGRVGRGDAAVVHLGVVGGLAWRPGGPGAAMGCQCNGHADTCNELDGTGCPCQNNTETGSCQNNAQLDKKDCYKQQCAKCRDSFHGHPVGGQQCYRLISVEQEYCLDPTSQSNCFHQPQLQHLGLGRTVLFGVQPKFTNVDIRITLDVTFGGVDLFVSTAYDTFAVDVDPATGRHAVRLLPAAGAEGANGTRLREERARGLVTYVTVREAAAALVVRGVRDRLVLTYPHELHALKSSRFYLLLLGVGAGGNATASQGLLFFRQDQAHIDLFVFFSVFFSCFFLFLSLCVLLWKAKQFLDARHEQRRHLQEMTKMASRPFAKVTVCFEGPPPIPWGPPHITMLS
nr:multiple epidermal growth factor-like domains protein 8 [Dromaius novaehollandiae]